jgi:hypothetical protein
MASVPEKPAFWVCVLVKSIPRIAETDLRIATPKSSAKTGGGTPRNKDVNVTVGEDKLWLPQIAEVDRDHRQCL